jgi:hypothetical protein
MKFYIAKRKCGCIVGGHTDDERSNRKSVAQWLSQWIKDGLTVEHIEADTVTIPTKPCEHENRENGLLL